MTKHTTPLHTIDLTEGPVQLRLLDDLIESPRPARFHLSRDTRVRGLQHAAEIRRAIAERQMARQGTATRAAERAA